MTSPSRTRAAGSTTTHRSPSTGPSSRRTAKPRSPCASSSATRRGWSGSTSRCTIEDLHDLDSVSRLLARQKPAWEPGTRHGYHAMTLGLYMQELIRHVDPSTARSAGSSMRRSRPLGIEFYIGLPPEIPDERLAQLRLFSPCARSGRCLGPQGVRDEDPVAVVAAAKVVAVRGSRPERSPCLEVEIPAGNGVGTARAIARAYSAFAEGGAELGITPETFARFTAVPRGRAPEGRGAGSTELDFSLGFLRPGPELGSARAPRVRRARCWRLVRLRRPRRAPRLRLRDEQHRLLPADDPREKALRDAVHRAIARLSG